MEKLPGSQKLDGNENISSSFVVIFKRYKLLLYSNINPMTKLWTEIAFRGAKIEL
jgi:hypothetical protein